MSFFARFQQLMQIEPARLSLAAVAFVSPLLIGLVSITGAFSWLLVIVVGVAILLMLAILLPMLFVFYSRHLDDIDSMRRGNYVAHWQYNEAEWQEFSSSESRRTWLQSFNIMLISLGLGGVLSAVGLIIFLNNGEIALLAIGLFLVVMAGVLMLLINVFGTTKAASEAYTGEVYVSERGIFKEPGGYIILNGVGTRLEAVTLEPGSPAKVNFQCAYQSRYGERSLTAARLSVPAGRDEEAQQLVARFNAPQIPSR